MQFAPIAVGDAPSQSVEFFRLGSVSRFSMERKAQVGIQIRSIAIETVEQMGKASFGSIDILDGIAVPIVGKFLPLPSMVQEKDEGLFQIKPDEAGIAIRFSFEDLFRRSHTASNLLNLMVNPDQAGALD